MWLINKTGERGKWAHVTVCKIGSECNLMVKCGSQAASPTVQELIFNLRSSFSVAEFQDVAKTLADREDHLKEQNIALRKKSEAFKKEKDVLFLENQKLKNDLKKKHKELDALQKENLEYKDQIKVLNCAPENSKPPLVDEKSDNKKNTKPKHQEIIQIDDDDDVLKSISTKRKRDCNEIKRECNSGDHIQNATQKKKTLEPITLNPHSTPPEITPRVEPRNLMSSLDTSASVSNLNRKKIDEAYKSILAKMKIKKGIWNFKSEMLEEFEKDDELCMNAICALYRRTSIKIPFFDKSRLTQLAQLLTDGDPQQKVKKTASELDRFDVDACRMMAKNYATEIFRIYQSKIDPFFPLLKN